MTDLPDEAVEAAARAMSVHWRDMHTNEALGRQRMLAEAALTAAAPYIADSVRRELLANTYTAEGGENVMRELGRAKAELADLLAWIRALRDEWRAVANPTPGYEYAMADCADALDALLLERAR